MNQDITCCFTGHRPNRLPWRENEWDDRCQRCKSALDELLERCYDDGYRHFMCGMAQGSDMLFCEAVLRAKDRHTDIQLEAAIPCDGQARRWSAQQQERYRRLVAQCDLETYVQHDYTPDCMMRRNYYLIERSSRVIALYDGTPSGGTYKTLLRGIQKGLDVIQLDPEDF